METRNCQNCKLDFNIESQDFDFYNKIKVPPPTFCPICRMQRRLTFRNTHSLYKRKDAFSGKDILSIYSADKPITAIDQKTWWGDTWDPVEYGKEYDFSRPFFEQWKEFRNAVPFQNLSNSKAVNSDYCNVAEESYDCYLISSAWKNERVMYSDAINFMKDSMDLYIMHRSEFSYDDVNCADSYKLFYSQDSHSCTDSYFLYDCKGCTDCYMSSNLRNKSYYFENQQLSKEDYIEKMKNLHLDSYLVVQEKKAQFEKMKLECIHRFAHIINSHNVLGDNIENAKNAMYCFDVTEGPEDSKYIFWGGMRIRDSYDCGPGTAECENLYECFDTGAGGGKSNFGSVIYYSTATDYCFNCYNCTNLFACIGLRNKHYCIFNKQYTKEEYLQIVEKIKQQMIDIPYVDSKGRTYAYGEFFPVGASPFCYNETVAQDYYPLTKEQAIEQGYSWKDPEERHHVPTLTASQLPDSIVEVSDSILDEVIECAHAGNCKDRCSTAFKIIPDELRFYTRFNIPLPRLCYGCRHYSRLAKRNPMKLWNRDCMCNQANHDHQEKCSNRFETTYSPERQEKIYCESCYQKEVL